MRQGKKRDAEYNDSQQLTSASRSQTTPKRRIRDSWGSRLGIIMAVAGSAIGLGILVKIAWRRKITQMDNLR